MKTLVITLVLLVGCAGAFVSIETINDEFDGYTIHRMKRNSLGGGGLMAAGEVEVCLNPQQFISADEVVVYSLIVDYTSSGNWLFIESGESLILLVDGERVGFSGDGSSSHREVLSGGAIHEKAWYDITRKELELIASAREVKVKISGQNHFVKRHFTARNFTNVKKFLADY